MIPELVRIGMASLGEVVSRPQLKMVGRTYRPFQLTTRTPSGSSSSRGYNRRSCLGFEDDLRSWNSSGTTIALSNAAAALLPSIRTFFFRCCRFWSANHLILLPLWVMALGMPLPSAAALLPVFEQTCVGRAAPKRTSGEAIAAASLSESVSSVNVEAIDMTSSESDKSVNVEAIDVADELRDRELDWEATLSR